MVSDYPARIGRYTVEGVLGRGAMGVVYKAHDPEIDRRVALKLIRADLLDGEAREVYMARFRREAQAAGRCSHPNIVTIYDFAVHEGNPFLAMEFIDGVSLDRARPEGGVFAPAVAGAIALGVLDALAAAHAGGIVHRDIKPANILLTNASRVKVTDFGICRFDNVQMTQDGAVIGTPSYMSPEQCRGDDVDARSDLFSTGAVLYEMLCGQRPFPGQNFHQVTQKLLHEPPADISAINPAVSAGMKAIIDRALAKRAEERFASAGDMAAALRAALGPGIAQVGAAQAGEPEGTIFLPRGTMPTATQKQVLATGLINLLGADAVATLERRLAHHVGPIAHYLVQSAVRKADSLDALCDSLASAIEQAPARDVFREEARRALRIDAGETAVSTSQTGGTSLSQDDLGRAEKALTQYLGPIARVMVKRAAAECRSAAELWARLATHIERDADRRAFLAGRRSGNE